MIMIIGGAWQGKTAFAESLTGMKEEDWISGENCGREDLFRCRGIVHFHEYVRRALREGWDLEGLPERLAAENPDLVLVTNELGYGIVPLDPQERIWRETDGRLCARLAAGAAEVWRVVCGIGSRLK